MKNVAEKFASLERDIATEKGDFTLFALFLREDSLDKWDLLVSAPWLETNKKKSLEYLAKEIYSRLDSHELLSLSRIVLLEKDNPGLEAIYRSIRVKHGMFEVKDSVFFGLQIKHAYIITSERQKSASNSSSHS